MKILLTTLVLGIGLLAGSAFAKAGDTRIIAEKSDWYGEDITNLDGKIYLSSHLGIREVDKNGTSRMLPLPKGWGAGLITSMDGKLYCFSGSWLVEVDKKGKIREINQDWPRTPAIAGVDGKVYAVSAEELFVSEKDGKYKRLGNYNWYLTRGMAELNGKLYILSRQQVFEVDTATGKERALNSTPINDPTKMAAGNGKIYVLHQVKAYRGQVAYMETALAEVDPATGNFTRIPLPADWDRWYTSAGPMTVMDGKLYVLLSAAAMRAHRLVSISLK